MLDLSGVTMRFGARTLFEKLNWHIAPAEKVGLVGDNGTGKTTLLKIIDRQISPEEGSISMPAGYKTGYLPQGGIEPASRSLRDEAIDAFSQINSLKAEMGEIGFQIDCSGDPDLALLNRYVDIEQQLRALGADRVETKIHFVLTGLGFQREKFSKPVAEFSSGWQMRAALAKLLLSSPDIVLLDEPTNYLDLEARMWLIDFLNECKQTVVMVCHDRFFLDQTVKRIADLGNGKLTDYYANYSGYIKAKSERIKILESTRARQEKEFARQQRFIERFRYKASKASQVQSRIKQLERFELVEVPQPTGSIRVVIPTPERSGLAVLSLQNAVAGYGGAPVLDAIDLEVRRGDRLALVGPNGVGKSTLMAVLAGRKTLESGERKTGHNVVPGYFEEELLRQMTGSLTVLETAEEQAPNEFRPALRGLLGVFGFSGDSVHKKVEVLSGGEKSRLAILCLLLSRPNVLLLDEPTNHLDMKTKDILLAALKKFGGAVVFVSHDRYFMDELATRVVEIGSGRITDYPGNYEHYLWRKTSPEQSPVPQKEAAQKKWKEKKGGLAWEKRKDLASRIRRAEKKVKAAQEKIAHLEAEVARLEIAMQEFYSIGENAKAAEVAKEHAALKDRLKKSYYEWEEAEDELAALLSEESA